ncbi:SDR family NAD(P)-dependent oxidoreductase [Streptomyces evansiae]|nr:SDR family NAD(P)-dependent oxidoreductase [Streptomyces sp. DSM 41859]MDT0424649.1 SDR family NAD(P)-dependent oxidoreductase [Streptomyces sp. DSM 41859]
MAVVTGAASGIGEATARGLADEVAAVVLADAAEAAGEQVAAGIRDTR